MQYTTSMSTENPVEEGELENGQLEIENKLLAKLSSMPESRDSGPVRTDPNSYDHRKKAELTTKLVQFLYGESHLVLG